MSEENFEFEYNVLQEMLIVNHQEGFSYNMCYEDDVYSVATKLNEQQATIEELERKVKKYEKIGEEQLKQIIDYQEEIKRLKCMNNQLERRLDYSIAYNMGECE